MSRSDEYSHLYLTDDRYLAALKRLREAIAGGREFKANDEPECSWGLCDPTKEMWPERTDHLWPEQFDKGRVAPKYREVHHRCPLDKRDVPTINGCFHTCAVFKRGRGGPFPTREEVIVLYDKQIALAQPVVAK